MREWHPISEASVAKDTKLAHTVSRNMTSWGSHRVQDGNLAHSILLHLVAGQQPKSGYEPFW